ncbi:MAG: HAD-IIIA family hydrolase [Nitrospirae bacterium]|jgi:3-deoxy-D-manno-octulosonate 8-phosphate phosphatase (KDO 8-P phosphatase)|nr:HAD-IIIA family hydrolase [Nitrospirota bacterium]
MRKISGKELKKLAKKIRLLILDVDGVLTDGSIILDNKNNELKSFHVRDGHGIKMLLKAGIKVAFITGRSSNVVKRRSEELGLKDIFQKCYDKMPAYNQLSQKYSLGDDEIAYVGDDIIDMPLLKRCGFPVAVSDSDDEVRSVAKMITRNKGGQGAVREVCDFILKSKGLWKGIIDEYSKA